MRARNLPRGELESKFLRRMDEEFSVVSNLLPQVTSICSNHVRASILHLPVNTPDTLHSMQVEEMAFRIGVRSRTVVYHLERLKQWKLVDVKKVQKHGDKSRMSIWGLNLENRDWIIKCYSNITTHFFDDAELDEMTSRNISFRKRRT
jgi:DNA-binding transcriptional ArsR family regulator